MARKNIFHCDHGAGLLKQHLKYFFLLLCWSGFARAQSTELIASRLLFHPLIASQFEPRLGVEKALDQNFLTLNIGNSVDLLAWRGVGADTSSELRAGADFFTWSHLLSGNDFRFPVQAIDYYFGVNASWVSRGSESDRWEARLRIAHISAHSVDGAYDNYNKRWVNGDPFTYSREFVDLIAARSLQLQWLWMRALCGGTILLHSIPADFAAVAPHAGLELHGDPASRFIPFAAYDFRIQRIDAWRASNAVHAGIKFGQWNATGTELYIAYESGESMHGEYFNLRSNDVFAGMNITF